MNCKLIAFDLDGTFLDTAKTVPEENLAALTAAAERGSRQPPSISEGSAPSALKAFSRPLR